MKYFKDSNHEIADLEAFVNTHQGEQKNVRIHLVQGTW